MNSNEAYSNSSIAPPIGAQTTSGAAQHLPGGRGRECGEQSGS